MRLQLLCSSLQSLRSLPLSFGGDSLLPKLKNCTSLHPLRTEFGMSRVYCSLIVGKNEDACRKFHQIGTGKRACIDWIGHFGAALRKSANPQDAPSLALVMGVHRHDKSLKFLVAQ